jgi:nucleoside-diphosphate-sugar epimerase
MPAIQAPAKVLVSGANGFIAVWVAQNLLDHGYSVRGAVRSTEKGEYLKKLFAKFGDKYEVIVVKDIMEVSLG